MTSGVDCSGYAAFLGEPNEEAFGSADLAEPVNVVELVDEQVALTRPTRYPLWPTSREKKSLEFQGFSFIFEGGLLHSAHGFYWVTVRGGRSPNRWGCDGKRPLR